MGILVLLALMSEMQVKHAAETSLTLGVVFVRYMSRWHGNHQAMCVRSIHGNNHLQSPHCFCLAQECRRCCHWQQIL